MTDNKKYIINIGDHSEEWTPDMYAEAADRLFADHKDANVFELEDAEDFDEDPSDHQYVINIGDHSEVWDGDMVKEAGASLKEEHPDVKIQRVSYKDYWGERATANREQRAALLQPDADRNARLAELGYYDDLSENQLEFNMDTNLGFGLKPLSSAIETSVVTGETRYLDPAVQEFFALDSANTDRMAEIARLDAEYDSNPAVIAQREWEAQQRAEQAKYIDTQLAAVRADMDSEVDAYHAAQGAQTKHGYDPYGANMTVQAIRMIQGEDVGKDMAENEKMETYQSAIKLYEMAKQANEIAGKGFWGAAGDVAMDKLRNLATQSDIEMYNEIGDILTRLESQYGSLENLTDEQIESGLSKAEQALIHGFFAYNEAMEAAGQNMSRAYKGGKIFGESISFMLEFLATGGIAKGTGKAAGNLVSKGLLRWARKAAAGTAKRTARAFTARAARGLTSALVGTAARTFAAPGTYHRAAEESVKIEDGHLDRTKNVFKSFADSYIENLSEISGGLIGKGLGLLGKGISKAASMSGIPFSKLGSLLADNRLMQTVTAGWKSIAPKFEALGFHGIFEEVGEEYIGNAIREFTIQPGALAEMHKDDNFGAMLIGFAPMTLFGGAMSAVSIGAKNIEAANLGKKLRETLGQHYSEEQIDHMMNLVSGAENSKDVWEAIKPLTVGLNAEEAQQLFQYGAFMAQNKAMLFAKKAQDDNLAQAKRAELQQTYNKFWQQDAEGAESVQLATLNDGRTVFVVSEPTADGVVSIIDAATGAKGFTNVSNYRAQEVDGAAVPMTQTWSMNAYLDAEIASERRTSEQARMEREYNEQVQNLQSQIQEGTKINLGTEGNPVIMLATGKFVKDGVVAVDQAGNTHTIGWNQVADTMNQPIRVKTDQQIIDEEMAAIVARNAERRKRMTDADPAMTDAVNESAAQSAEVVAQENRHIPMNEDGTVNEAAFWEQDPEGYVQWNDEQNQDGGADSLQQVAITKAVLTSLLAEAQQAQQTSNPAERKAAKQRAQEIAEKINRLTAIEAGYAEQRIAPLRERAMKWKSLTNAPVYIVETEEDLASISGQAAASNKGGVRVRGFAKDGRAYIYLPGIVEESEIDAVFMHEAVAHTGLKGLLGQQAFDELCDQVWEMMSPEMQAVFINYPGVNENTRAAADEYIAHLAETMGAGIAEAEEKTIWQSIIDFVRNILRSMGIALNVSESELSDLIHMAYADLAKNMAEAEDIAVQQQEARTAEREAPSTARQEYDTYAEDLTHDEIKAVAENEFNAAQEAYNALAASAPKVEMGESAKDFIARKKAYNEQVAEAKAALDARQALIDEIARIDAANAPVLTDAEVLEQEGLDALGLDESAAEGEDVRFSVASDAVLNFFNMAREGKLKGKPIKIGSLTSEGKDFLEKLSGIKMRDNVSFALNPSDLVHIYNDHYGNNEKDKGNNIPLNDYDIRRLVDVIAFPTKVVYGVDSENRKVFYFLADTPSGAYNLMEIYANKKGTLTAKTYYKTKKGATQRVMELESLLPTSETYSGATLSNAKIPKLFDVAIEEDIRLSVITPEMDAEYLAAVERGDMETAQRMVLEAAKLAMPNTAMIDRNGYPKIFYHNTDAEFTAFGAEYNGTATDAGWLGDGFYFYGDPTEGDLYGRNKMQVFLNIEEPYYATSEENKFLAEANSRKESISFSERLKEEWYDGVYYNGDLRQEAVAFYPSQIKSADPVTYDDAGNVIPLSERFNPEKDDIRFSIVRIDPNANQQAEGNVMFSTRRGSLVGMHNISEEKLRKLIKQGGSANPSTAVIDIERQSFDSYGDISLIMPSSLVDAKTGRNAGTFTADAWTPTYPQIEKRFSDDNLQRAYWRDITAIPEEMQHEVRMAFDSWLDNRTASGLAYMFLQERGEAPEMVRVAAKFPQEIKDKMSAILGEGRTGLYELTDEEKQAVLDLYIQENFGGSREDFDSSIAETIQRIEDRLSTGKVPSFVEKRITADLQWMKEHGYNYDNLSDFVRNIVSDIRHAGEVNDAATTNRALDYIKDNNLSAEYEQWKESLNDRYGIKEYLFDGYTPSGNPRWLPNTVENASKLMNKQGLAGATGMASSFNRFVATLAPKKKSLSDIRSSKERLVEDEKLVDDFRDKWSEVFFDLGIKCQPDAKGYEDYGLVRLTEAAQKKNPGAYLKKEYGVELSQEDLQRLADMIKAIKTEFPARYFETKFQRPVYLNEFAAAVIPTTTSADIKQAIAEAGLPIFEYDSSADGARREATLKATDIEGVRFSVFEPHNATMDEIDSLFHDYNGDKSLEPLYDKVSAQAHTMGLQIRFDYPWSAAAGSTFGDKVKFNTEFFNSLAYKSQDKAHALLHEMIHATTNYAIAARNTGALTEGMKEAVSQLESIYDEIVNDRSFDGTYGAKSIYEMVAELSNPEFRNLLKEKNLFQRIVDAIKRLLGIEVGENALDNLSATLDYMLDNYDGRVFGAVVNQYQKHQEYTRFSVANENQAIFVSNAARAVEGVKMEKATPAQWLAMIEKSGGLKAGEDKWMGLSDWLKTSDKKTLTKQEVLDFIGEHMIQIEEQHYSEGEDSEYEKKREVEEALQSIFDEYVVESEEENDDIFMATHYHYAIEKLIAELGYSGWGAPFVNHNGTVELDIEEEDYDTLNELCDKLGIERFNGTRSIDDTRIQYTTSGLTNKHEIALTVPTIESWEERDYLHFGDAGEGRAVAWIRFGETKTYAKEYDDFYAFQKKMQQKYFPDRRISALSNSDLESLTAEEKAEFERLRDIARSIPMKERTRRRVLVIDEIQSKRHQEGREKGYRVTNVDKWLKDNNVEVVETGEFFEFIKNGGTDRRFSKGLMNYDIEKAKRLYVSGYNKSDIPDAPFDKNWHELAMKRMLRYAAEEGYDAIAWTKGEQQAERYDIGSVVTAVDYRLNDDGTYRVDTMGALGYQIENVPTTFTNEQELADVFGKEIAKKIVSNLEGKKADIESANREALELREKMRKVEDKDSAEYEALLVEFAKISEKRANAEKGFSLSETDFRIGGEGMKGFYDKMLPAFMNKYGKKWGIKVADIILPNLEEAGRVMHSVPVTEEMKASVMEGQVMFSAVQIDPVVRQEMDTIKAKAMWDGTFMKAPNGADTKLTEDQWLLVRTKNFINWFGDWINDPENASKVVDENGEPMVVYHGTGADFTKFDASESDRGHYYWKIAHFGTREQAEDVMRTSPGNKHIMELFLNIRKPYRISDQGGGDEWGYAAKQAANGMFADQNGENADGLVYLNEYEGKIPADSYAVWNPSQIKSATETTGLFSESEDIRFSAVTEAEEVEPRFSVVTDPALLDQLNNEEYIILYRAMQLIDGKLYPPMAGKVAFKEGEEASWGEPTPEQTWLQSDETPWNAVHARYDEDSKDGKHKKGDLKYDKNGDPVWVFKLDKGNGKTLYAAYNPYIHTSASPLNDQFSEAQSRSNLVVVRVLVPKSELTSGYKAEKAKDSVGMKPWHKGPISGVLAQYEGKGREVMLTRYAKIDGIVDFSEVADETMRLFEGTGLLDNPLPTNVFMPGLREELEKRGVQFVETTNKGEIKEGADKGKTWAKVYGKDGLGKKPKTPRKTKKSKKAKNVRFSAISTPTDNVVAEGMKFSIQDFARLAGNIFQDMPESFRKEAIEETFKRGWDMQSAIFQIPARLAEKENWDEADKELAKVIREKVQDAMDESGVVMSRPLTTKEALWMLYRSTEANSDSMMDAAKRSIVAHNLGFDSRSMALKKKADDNIRYSVVRNGQIDAATDMYNYEANLLINRLKESWFDMNKSVIALQNALADASGKPIASWENVELALNQLPSKSYAEKKKYLRDFLMPLWDQIIEMTKVSGLSIEQIERYMMLKHGLERNKKFAMRDAKQFYREMYDKVADRMKNTSHAEQVVALSEANKRIADIDAQIANASGKKLKDLQEAREREVVEKEIAELVLRNDEQQNEADLQMYFNAIEAENNPKYAEFREKDYGGLTSMFMDQIADVKRSDYKTDEAYQAALLASVKPRFDKVADMEAEAQKEVDDYESKAYMPSLWKLVNAATKETLRHQHAAGVITTEQYDAVRNMFDYYVPLRGFADNTAEDMYSYYMNNSAGGFAKPIIAAKGRKTRAESPLGWIGTMAESAIQQDNKNEAKMKLYYALINRPDTGVLSLSEMWYVYDHTDPNTGKKVFVPAYPPATGGVLTADQMRQHMDAWEQSMKAKQAVGQAYKKEQGVSLGGSVIFQDKTQDAEHIIRVKVAGKDYAILVNGNPRAAQAVNGLLNPDAEENMGLELYKAVQRFVTSGQTSASHNFWFTNFMRDMLMSVPRMHMMYDGKFAAKYAWNRHKAWRVFLYLFRNEKSPLGNSYFEKMYKEFAENGGITGYTVLANNKEYEALFDKYSKEVKSPKLVKFFRALKDGWFSLGEAIEQVSRFAAYITAREDGMPIEESIAAAKEVSVNFNRKGSAKSITRDEIKKLHMKNGLTLKQYFDANVGKVSPKAADAITKAAEGIVMGLSSVPYFGRILYFFFNAGVQSTSSLVRLARQRPDAALSWYGLYGLLGFMMAEIIGALWDDDDEEVYRNLPEYERRNSIMVPIGDGVYLKWAIPQELRTAYGVGDAISQRSAGLSHHLKGRDAVADITDELTDFMPINPFESYGLYPDLLTPIEEIKRNKSGFGSPIYREYAWKSEEEMEHFPKYRLATPKTNPIIVDMTKVLNDATAEHEGEAGWINWNPASIEHLLKGYLGGRYTTAVELYHLGRLLAGKEEFQIKNTPFAKRVLLSTDEVNMNSRTNEAFYYYRGISENAERVENEYRQSDAPSRADDYRKEDDWRIHMLFRQYEEDLKMADEKVKKAVDDTEKDLALQEQNIIREMLLNDIASGKSPDLTTEVRMAIKQLKKKVSDDMKPARDADKKRLERKRAGDLDGMLEAIQLRDSLKAEPRYQRAEAMKNLIKEIEDDMEAIGVAGNATQRDSLLGELQKKYEALMQKAAEEIE